MRDTAQLGTLATYLTNNFVSCGSACSTTELPRGRGGEWQLEGGKVRAEPIVDAAASCIPGYRRCLDSALV